MKPRLLTFIGAAALLAACSDSTGLDNGPRVTLSFSTRSAQPGVSARMVGAAARDTLLDARFCETSAPPGRGILASVPFQGDP